MSNRTGEALKDEGEGIAKELQKVVRLDGPAKINWLCKAHKRSQRPSLNSLN